MSAGNTFARIAIIIHIYLLCWLLFIIGYIIFKAARSNTIRENIKQLATKISQRVRKNEMRKKGGTEDE
jgi:cell division protein FtsL